MDPGLAAYLNALIAMPDTVVVRPVDPAGDNVSLFKIGEGTSNYKTSSWWQWTKRPKRVSMSEYIGGDGYELTVPGIMSHEYSGTGIQQQLEVLRGIQRNPVGPRNEPAVVTVTGAAVHLAWLRWVIEDITIKDELRDERNAWMDWVAFDVTFLQWEPTDLTVLRHTPAQTAAASPPSGATKSSRTYTVRSGDTLSGIAARLLGDANRWHDIQALNNIRDPNMISVGQVLRLP